MNSSSAEQHTLAHFCFCYVIAFLNLMWVNAFWIFIYTHKYTTTLTLFNYFCQLEKTCSMILERRNFFKLALILIKMSFKFVLHQSTDVRRNPLKLVSTNDTMNKHSFWLKTMLKVEILKEFWKINITKETVLHIMTFIDKSWCYGNIYFL